MGSSHLGNTDGYNPVNPSLPKYTVGDALSVNGFQATNRAIDRATITSGNGYQVVRYSNSTVLRPTNYVVGGKFRNFQVYGFTDKTQQGWATVAIGTINRTIPKIGSYYLDQVIPIGETEVPPKIAVTGEGYIVLEVNYDSSKAFPSASEVKFVSQLQADEQTSTSQYPLAKVVYKPANAGKKTDADVVVSQIHSEGNLSVARIKVGASKVYWQWWIV